MLNWSESNKNVIKPICDINLCNKNAVFEIFRDILVKILSILGYALNTDFPLDVQKVFP